MNAQRIESDTLGSVKLPANALYGIHSQRAIENFPLTGRRIHPALISAYGAVKQACIETAAPFTNWPSAKVDAMRQACIEMQEGQLNEHILVDPLQGGAGTSTNMNINEVIANRALLLMGMTPGQYDNIHPIDDINRFQSTNDTYPTALRVAAIRRSTALASALTNLQQGFEAKEREFANIVKMGRTQLQDAVLTTLGRTMSAFAEAFARDRWRLYKCEERLRVINLGGTAIGTGLGAPRPYIFQVSERLRAITGLGLARAENLIDATQNVDNLVEVSGMAKTCATNLQKCANDLRMLASGPHAGLAEIQLPPRQAGSSIMPGKVNPVIPEAAWQCATQVQACDLAITQAAAAGSLELNAFMPLLADNLLNALELLANACQMLHDACVDNIRPNPQKCNRDVSTATASITALVEKLGYARACEISAAATQSHTPLSEYLAANNIMTPAEFATATAPEQVLRLGSPPPQPE